MRTTLMFSLCAAVALAAPACSSSSSSSGPFIDTVTVTDSPVPQNADGSYTIDITVDYTDDLLVDTYDFDSDAANIHITGAIPDALASSFTLTIDLPTGTASGTVDFLMDVVDTDNLVSNQVSGVVVLE